MFFTNIFWEHFFNRTEDSLSFRVYNLVTVIQLKSQLAVDTVIKFRHLIFRFLCTTE